MLARVSDSLYVIEARVACTPAVQIWLLCLKNRTLCFYKLYLGKIRLKNIKVQYTLQKLCSIEGLMLAGVIWVIDT